MEINNKVPFDPGFSEFSAAIPDSAFLILNDIKNLSQPHKRKFEFQRLQVNLVAIIKSCAAVYLGCVLWGAYLSNRYKGDPRGISGNIIMQMSEEQRNEVDYEEELNLIIGLIDRLDKDSRYYLKKPGILTKEIIPYLEAYREFCRLNKNFVELDSTDKIKLPVEAVHFADYDNQKLDELKARIEEIIASKKVETLLEIGFYTELRNKR